MLTAKQIEVLNFVDKERIHSIYNSPFIKIDETYRNKNFIDDHSKLEKEGYITYCPKDNVIQYYVLTFKGKMALAANS